MILLKRTTKCPPQTYSQSRLRSVNHTTVLMQDVTANVATGVSVTSTAVAWVAQANEIVSLIAGLVAIVAGIYAILHYRKALKKP